MGNIYSQGRDISCDFCGTGTEGLKRIIRDPSKGRGSREGEETSHKICAECRTKAREKDPEGWDRRIESGRYRIEEL